MIRMRRLSCVASFEGRFVVEHEAMMRTRDKKKKRNNRHFERLDRFMFEPVEVPNWLLLIYQSSQRFEQQSVEQIIAGFVRDAELLVKTCRAVGKTFKRARLATTILMI